MNISQYNALFTQEPRGLSLPMIIAFHFATLVHVLWPLFFIMMQQFSTGMQNWGHLVKTCCTKTTLPEDILHNLTLCYLLKQRPLSKSFPNTLRIIEKEKDRVIKYRICSRNLCTFFLFWPLKNRGV